MSEIIVGSVTSYLKQPYARLIMPEDDGSFRGEILEFPGCIATGDNPSETLLALEDAAASWLEAAIEHGQPIPDPVDSSAFSGRMVLRIPKSLHKKASRIAQRDGVSLNQFIVAGLAEHVGERASARASRTINFIISGPNAPFYPVSNIGVAGSLIGMVGSASAVSGGFTVTPDFHQLSVR